MNDESIREYITHFNNEVLEVRNVQPNLVLYFFIKGLKPGAFSKALAGEKPMSMDDLKAKAKKWIRIEEWRRPRLLKQLKTKIKEKTLKILNIGAKKISCKINRQRDPGDCSQNIPL
jgi:hypothetical protein